MNAALNFADSCKFWLWEMLQKVPNWMVPHIAGVDTRNILCMKIAGDFLCALPENCETTPPSDYCTSSGLCRAAKLSVCLRMIFRDCKYSSSMFCFLVPDF